MKKLQVLPKLRALVLLGKLNFVVETNLKKYKKYLFHFFKDTPLTENSDYRLEVLISVRRLERLDKDEYLEEERGEAETIYEERRVKEQEEAAAMASAAINDDVAQNGQEKIAEDGDAKNDNEE